MDALVARLGKPDFRRSEPPGELWQYRGADCVLDVFLLRRDGAYRVIQSAVRDRHEPGAGRCGEAALGEPAARENGRAAELFPD